MIRNRTITNMNNFFYEKLNVQILHNINERKEKEVKGMQHYPNNENY